jgi:hypothetical protein
LIWVEAIWSSHRSMRRNWNRSIRNFFSVFNVFLFMQNLNICFCMFSIHCIYNFHFHVIPLVYIFIWRCVFKVLSTLVRIYLTGLNKMMD